MTRSSVTASNLFSLSSSEISAWNGWELDKDWALNFKFKKAASNYSYLFAFDINSTSHYTKMVSFETAPSEYRFRLKHYAGTPGGQFSFNIPYTTVSAADVQWLFSYNKQNYTAGGGDNDPVWSTTTNGAGLSVYYRMSTNGGTSYGSWTQITIGTENITEATVVVKHQSGMFGKSAQHGYPLLSGSEVTDIQMWNTTRLTSEI